MRTDHDPAGAPLAELEYELTDELAAQGALALFEVQARDVKQKIMLLGAPHPALPIVIASAMLLICMAIAIWLSSDSLITLALVGMGILVQLLLLFKAALYFWPGFAQWYIRQAVLRSTRRMASRTIRWKFYEDRLETQSASSQRRLAWTNLENVEVSRDFWLLIWKSGPALAIAAAVLPEPLRLFLLRKADGA